MVKPALGAALLGVVLLGAIVVPSSGAVFQASTSNGANSFSAGIWDLSDRMAVFRTTGTPTPLSSVWDGASFAGSQKTGIVGNFRILQGAASRVRHEAVVVGTDTGGTIAGGLWDGTTWTALPALGTVSQTYWWSEAVAYESASGDAMVVYADGAALNYRVWNGSTWSAEASITEPVTGTPRQIRLAADPQSDEMVLVVSTDSSVDWAVVWNGTAWGNSIVLAPDGSGNDRTDIDVAYESQSGRAMVVFGAGTDDAHYRIWNSGWSSESTLAGLGGGYARWTRLASDPTADRIALGVLTNDSDVWLAVWNGAGWVDQTTATTASTGTNRPAVDVAFQGGSGGAIAVYGEASNNPRYRVWDAASGWSAESSAPGIGATPNSVMLYRGSGTDGVMLAVQDDSSDLHWIHWDGSSWGPDNELETESGETKNQPFLFL